MQKECSHTKPRGDTLGSSRNTQVPLFGPCATPRTPYTRAALGTGQPQPQDTTRAAAFLAIARAMAPTAKRATSTCRAASSRSRALDGLQEDDASGSTPQRPSKKDFVSPSSVATHDVVDAATPPRLTPPRRRRRRSSTTPKWTVGINPLGEGLVGSAPTRDATGEFVFDDAPDFRPNMSPAEVAGGAGTCLPSK